MSQWTNARGASPSLGHDRRAQVVGTARGRGVPRAQRDEGEALNSSNGGGGDRDGR